MAKILLLSVIAVSVSAQFAQERRTHDIGNLRVNQEGESRLNNQRHRHDHVHVGGFQNGHFAQNDGRLRTNLDSKPNYDNYQLEDESMYFVEEGAAFKRPAHHDVHSSLGRVVDISTAIQEDNGRRVIENVQSQDNGRRDQRRTDENSQPERQMGQNLYEQNADQNRQYQTNRNESNTQQPINQESSHENEGQANSRQIGQHTDNLQETGNQNKFGNQNTQQITVKKRNGAGTNNKPVPNVNNESPVKANQSYDQEAIDRELNNQLTRMIFEESVLEVTTKSNTKTTEENELPRNKSEKEDDRWIWSDGDVVKNETTTVTPTVDDRAAFVGDQCPTGQVRFNKVCVDVD